MPLKKIKIIIGPLVALLILFFADFGEGHIMEVRMAAIAAWMAIWWLTEAVHLAITALLPVILLPLTGIAGSSLVAQQYMDPIIFLFIGGFIIAFAIERWNLHERIALKILTLVGASPTGILGGIMLSAYFISMWISNTATVMMLISSVLALAAQTSKYTNSETATKKLNAALLIGLAYSSSIGGMATLVGTPTNMIFLREYTKIAPESNMGFANWFVVGFPVSAILLILCFIILKLLLLRNVAFTISGREYFKKQYSELGPMSFEEKCVGAIFITTAVLWFTRTGLVVGDINIPGWDSLFEDSSFVHDSTVAIIMALLLFLIPSKNESGKNILEWDDVTKLPFDIILLFGGGFALAKGLEVSGLSAYIASNINLSGFSSYFILLLVLCALITVISEFASNVACIQLMIPLLVAVAPSTGYDVLLLLLPATLASSLGFMLPVATAPNTIVYASKKIKANDMMKAGIIIDLIGVIVIALIMLIYKHFS